MCHQNIITAWGGDAGKRLVQAARAGASATSRPDKEHQSFRLGAQFYASTSTTLGKS